MKKRKKGFYWRRTELFLAIESLEDRWLPCTHPFSLASSIREAAAVAVRAPLTPHQDGSLTQSTIGRSNCSPAAVSLTSVRDIQNHPGSHSSPGNRPEKSPSPQEPAHLRGKQESASEKQENKKEQVSFPKEKKTDSHPGTDKKISAHQPPSDRSKSEKPPKEPADSPGKTNHFPVPLVDNGRPLPDADPSWEIPLPSPGNGQGRGKAEGPSGFDLAPSVDAGFGLPGAGNGLPLVPSTSASEDSPGATPVYPFHPEVVAMLFSSISLSGPSGAEPDGHSGRHVGEPWPLVVPAGPRAIGTPSIFIPEEQQASENDSGKPRQKELRVDRGTLLEKGRITPGEEAQPVPQAAGLVTSGMFWGLHPFDWAAETFGSSVPGQEEKASKILFWLGTAMWFTAAAFTWESLRRHLRRQAIGVLPAFLEPSDPAPEDHS